MITVELSTIQIGIIVVGESLGLVDLSLLCAGEGRDAGEPNSFSSSLSTASSRSGCIGLDASISLSATIVTVFEKRVRVGGETRVDQIR